MTATLEAEFRASGAQALRELDGGLVGRLLAGCARPGGEPNAVRMLSLPKAVAAAGGIVAWNSQSAAASAMLARMCTASTLDGVIDEIKAVLILGHNLWGYAYMRMLYSRCRELYYSALLSQPSFLLPVVYTPTVGEACQKLGRMPFYRRGCYVSITNSGNINAVLEEYAEAELGRGKDGKYLCDCVVFSDGGRILGLGDLGAWGMGIPIGKLDLYTVCAGVNPARTMPVIIDVGCGSPNENTDHLVIRDHPRYTGLKQARVKHISPAGTEVNSAYFGEDSIIGEFLQACTDLFGRNCLMQFEDFNSNDAFPLLAAYREKFLCYNDDIQGTAAVAVAGLMGAIKLKKPACTDLIAELQKETFFFHGAGSANIGALSLLEKEAHVSRSSLFITNSRGIIWRSEDGKEGSFRNDEQKEFALVGKPAFDSKDLVTCIEQLKPTVVVGAVGRDPGCFDQKFIDTVVRINDPSRPVVFALSNPKTQAEVTAHDAYTWSNGAVIYGSGTAFDPVVIDNKKHTPGQVNNVYIFPGMSFGAISCHASTIPDRLFMVAAEAVANSLDAEDLRADRVVPHPDRIRVVGANVAAAVAYEAQALGIAGRRLGESLEEVRSTIAGMMWAPDVASAGAALRANL